MVRRRISATLSIALILGMVLCTSSSPRAFTDNPCEGTHGPYTDTLCGGEHLVPNGYLVAYPYILWFSDLGALDLYDITNYESWELVHHYWDSYSDPSILEALSLDNEEGCFCAWDSSEIIFGLLWDWNDGEGPDGDWFIQLSSTDHHLRIYDQGGNRLLAVR